MTIHPTIREGSRAFSLIEVVLTLGIVSFSLLAVIGLLPVGLQSIKNANNEAGAATVVGGIANALRNASTTNGIDYTGSYAGKTINFSVGTTAAGPLIEWDNLTLNGTASAQQKRLFARLEIVNQPDPTTPGKAIISVAWSARSPQLVWVPNEWNNADGSITSGLQFLPKP